MLIGGVWILLSDKLAAFIFVTPAQLSIAQTYKGWFFILVTSLLLYQYIKYTIRTQNQAEQNYTDLFESSEEGIFR